MICPEVRSTFLLRSRQSVEFGQWPLKCQSDLSHHLCKVGLEVSRSDEVKFVKRTEIAQPPICRTPAAQPQTEKFPIFVPIDVNIQPHCHRPFPIAVQPLIKWSKVHRNSSRWRERATSHLTDVQVVMLVAQGIIINPPVALLFFRQGRYRPSKHLDRRCPSCSGQMKPNEFRRQNHPSNIEVNPRDAKANSQAFEHPMDDSLLRMPMALGQARSFGDVFKRE